MDERDLEQRMRAAVLDEPPMPGGHGLDLANGRRLRRQRRAGVAVAASAAAAAVVAAAAWLPGAGGDDLGIEVAGSDGASDPSGPVTESAEPPGQSPHPGVTHTSPTPGGGHASGAGSGGGAIMAGGHRDTRELIYQVGRDRLDPKGAFLRFEQNVQTGGRDVVGTKLGWRADGDAGEGMVMVTIGADGAFTGSFGGCGIQACHDYTAPDGTVAKVGGATEGSGAFWLRVLQDDGDAVAVMIDPLFGNNSLVPTDAMTITLDEAIAFAADERLDIVD